MEKNKIYCRDCLDGLKNISNNTIQLIVTSPPYYNAKDYSKYNSVKHYFQVMKRIFSEVFRVLEKGRMCIVNISPVLIERPSRNTQSYRIALPFHFEVMMENIGFELNKEYHKIAEARLKDVMAQTKLSEMIK